MDSRRFFLAISTIVFAASAAGTIGWCASMSAMGEMPMPGGWTLSMMWMEMPGSTSLGAAASFLGMWVLMMVAMMLPSLTPLLWRYRESIGTLGGLRTGCLTLLVGMGYFAVWTALGVVVFAIGSVLAAIALEEAALAGAVPMVAGTAVVLAGVVQQTGWKARHLASCREASRHRLTPSAGAGAAWRHGWCVGVHCVQSCAGLTAVVLALGVMDVRVMSAVAVAITVERLAPAGVRAARTIGMVVVAAGLFLMVRAVGLG